MRNLFTFIVRHNFIFLFLLLQVMAFWLMFKNGSYQGSNILNSSNKVVAGIYQMSANASEYFGLRQENDRLAMENKVLRNALKSNLYVLPLKVYKIRDTLYRQQYSYIAGKVVNSSVNKRRNYMTINVGGDMGIRRDMGVMSSNGIVGIVTDVSGNFSSVMSLLHKDLKINCKLKREGSFGPLVWDMVDYRHCILTDIPTHLKIKTGDTVITSELSGIFPEGLMVGTVESYERRQNESFYTLRVKLSADLKKVNHVYVIKNQFKEERDSLELKTQQQGDD
ncbi:MAG TPA: rod shape-determining protein MreC [Bacteroidia bacterium]|nr:rod shape-determining protein MreC [Bacteroidia bacterium]